MYTIHVQTTCMNMDIVRPISDSANARLAIFPRRMAKLPIGTVIRPIHSLKPRYSQVNHICELIRSLALILW